jgi:hypothetical protein
MAIDTQVIIHGLLFCLAFGVIYLAFFSDSL